MAVNCEKNTNMRNYVARHVHKHVSTSWVAHPLKQSQMLQITPLLRDIWKYPVCVS